MTPSANFSQWIDQVPKWRGWLQLSPARAYMHDEEEYDHFHGNAAPDPSEGEGLCALLAKHAVDTTGPALEIGCGSGFLTFGLARHYPGPDLLITDPSATFLKLTQTHFSETDAFPARRHYAVLNADDVGRLPGGMFSLIAMRSTLHHILRYEEFIVECARSLRPAGALVMGAEPCESGYQLMGTVAKSIPAAFKAAGVDLKPAWAAKLDELTEAVKFYCLRDLEKFAAEDKHLFNPRELAELGRRVGLQLHFYPTAAFREFAPPFHRGFHGFGHFFLIYLEFCMGCEKEFVELVRVHLRELLSYVDDCYRSHPGPEITGVFVFTKGG
ncbi:MAG: hypothetical protein C0518_02975 [Opitutus sp.]|nr:hypothetical protein [Opitutus sp.]